MKVSPVRHPLESLGIVRIERGDIRVERLSARTEPAIPFPHRHDFYQLLWMQKCSGWHEIDFQRYQVSAHQIFVMKPGQVHAWKFSAQSEGVIIEFSTESLAADRMGSSLEEILLQLPDLVTLKGPMIKTLHLQINEMLQEFDARKASYERILEAYLRILIFNLARSAKGRVHHDFESGVTIARFQKMVEDNFRQHHGLEHYSEQMGLSPRALTMRTTRHLNKSGRQIIFDRILLEAKRLLAYTDQSIAGIGYGLGFEDANHFSRFFKTQSGMTAQIFRQRHRKAS